MADQGSDGPVVRPVSLSPDLARRIAVTLKHPLEDLDEGAPMPAGWHLAMIGAETRHQQLRPDGFPGLGAPFPDVPGSRLLALGRTYRRFADVLIGEAFVRSSRSTVVSIKSGPAGTMARVDVAHSFRSLASGHICLEESQSFLTLDGRFQSGQSNYTQAPADAKFIRTIVPDDIMLMQFSALSLNTHRIHWDRDFARKVEGYPDLVVNGGLVTVLMTDLLGSLRGDQIVGYTVRNLAPLFCGEPIHLLSSKGEAGPMLIATNDSGIIAAEMDIHVE